MPALPRALIACLALAVAPLRAGHAADRFTFLTSWFAQAEHGGYYQAKALGLYAQQGLDVTIRMGGPQVNGSQLLLAGEADAFSGYDFQVLSGVAHGLPMVSIGAAFQHDLQGILTHPDIATPGDLKGHDILISTPARASFWPWLRQRYGFTDAQAKPYTFSLGPFLTDPTLAQQAFPSSEPYVLQQQGVPYHFFLFADDGFPPYGGSVVTTWRTLAERPDVLTRFLRASMQGWRAYLENPAPGNALIQADNPKMPDGQLAFAVDELKRRHVVDGGDAAREGIGIITEARWTAIHDYMVQAGLLDAAADWRRAFTPALIAPLRVMPQ